MPSPFISPDLQVICNNARTTATVYYIREHGLVESLRIISDLLHTPSIDKDMKQYLYNLESIMLTSSGTLASLELFLRKDEL